MKKLLLLLLLASCSQAKKIQKAKETLDRNELEAAKYCASKYPVKDTTVYLPGEVRFDTLYQLQDVVIPVECPPSDVKTVIQWKVKESVRTVVQSKTDTVVKTVENTAKVRAAEIEKDRAQMESMEKDEVINKKTKRFWWLIIYASGMTVFAFRKPIFTFLKTFV